MLPVIFAICAAGFAVIAFAGNPVVLIIGAVANCFGTGLLLPSMLTIAMSKLDFADRGRGTGLWTATFFTGAFLCPLALLALSGAVSGLATAVGLLGVAAIVMAAGLAPGLRRAVGRRVPGVAGGPRAAPGARASTVMARVCARSAYASAARTPVGGALCWDARVSR
jgi:hypothetical protein